MKKMRRNLVLLFLLAAAVLLLPGMKAQAIGRAVVLDQEKIILCPGDKQTIHMFVGNGAVQPEKWKSSNKKVATISKSGVIKAKKAGKTVITCKTGYGYDLTCQVTVKKRVDMSKYLNKKYTKLLKKTKLAQRAASDPIGANNLYVFEDNSLFFRYDKSTKKITVLQNNYDRTLSLYGVTLGMKPKTAKKYLLKAGCKFIEKNTYPAVTDCIFKKSGHTITVKLRNGKVDCVQWNR